MTRCGEASGRFLVRPVWYPSDTGAVSFATEDEGQAVYHREPDAYGVYELQWGGAMDNLVDCPTRAAATSWALTVRVRTGS